MLVMVPSLRSFRMGGPFKKDPALSPTLSATTTASAFDWGDGQERIVIVTRADVSLTQQQGHHQLGC